MKEISKSKQAAILMAATLVPLAALFVLLELGLSWFYHHPPAGPPSLLAGMRHYYIEYGRSVIQFRPEFARYDPNLSYTLRPGRFVFANIEFATPYSVNSLGVRDDEQSLQAPEIVVVGDSHAMGWGVGQDETFAQRLEQATGLTVLNAGVSSYGTAREMKILRQIDTSHLRYLIIQYCQNDYEENKAYQEHGNHLPIMSPERYQKTVDYHLDRSAYYFGKYTLKLLPSLIRHPLKAVFLKKEKDQGVDSTEEARAFLNALDHSGVDLSGVTVIVFEVNAFMEIDDGFPKALRALVEKDTAKAGYKRLLIKDFSKTFRPEYFFPLDGHTNARGHRFIAGQLLPEIQEERPEG